MLIRVGVNGLVAGLTYQVADVNLAPGFTAAVYLGREPEGGMRRFALAGSGEVIALSAACVAGRVFVVGPPLVEPGEGDDPWDFGYE